MQSHVIKYMLDMSHLQRVGLCSLGYVFVQLFVEQCQFLKHLNFITDKMWRAVDFRQDSQAHHALQELKRNRKIITTFTE